MTLGKITSIKERVARGLIAKVHLDKKWFVVDGTKCWGWVGQCDKCGQSYLFTDELFASVPVRIPTNGEA